MAADAWNPRMNPKPTYEDILRVMAKASVGDATARVAVHEDADLDDPVSALALALNILLDDLDLQHRELRRSYAEIQAQQAAIRRLWTPVLTVAEHVLLLPLLGWIDIERAQQMMATVLNRIHASGARAVIVDLTGVPKIDAHAAAALGRLASAVHLLGAGVVIAGISAAVAQAMTVAGIDFQNMRMEADLAKAIRSALALVRRGQAQAWPD